MNLEEKRKRQLELRNLMAAMLDKADTEKRSLSEEETKDYAKHDKEFDALKIDIARAEKLEERTAEISTVERRTVAAVNPTERQEKDSRLGLSKDEIRQYSLTRAIRCLADKRPLDGFEGEVSQGEARRLGRDPDGFFVPMEVLAHGVEQRAMQVGSAAAGGYTVATEVDFTNMVELLRNQSHVMALGARVITGLQGDLTIPRVLSGGVAYWVSETGEISSSQASFGQLKVSPRRLGASVPYTKQLLAQSGLGIDNFIRSDIMEAFGLELDRVAINGSGAAQPRGILQLANAERATSVTFGAAPTWAKVVDLETQVAKANALELPGGAYGYLTTPGVKGAWKTTPKVANTATFLWEGDQVNGYAARSTNQVPDNKVIYGQFGQVMFFEWAGIDITVDPYTLAASNQVKVTIQKHVDMIVRQGKAFSVSTDAGNQ